MGLAKTGLLLRDHQVTKPGHFRIPEADRSPKTPPQIAALLQRANGAGRHVGLLCEQIERSRHQWGARQIQGVLSLVKKYGFEVVDDCCRVALEVEVPTYRLVNKLVKRPSMPHGELQQTHELIRQLKHYSDVISRKTEAGRP